MAVSEPSKADWAAVRAEYEAGEIPIHHILVRHGITGTALYARRRIENWPKRNGRPATMPKDSARRLVGRLMRLIEGQIAGFENKYSQDELMNESELRQLETMTKAIDKLIALDKASAATEKQKVQISPELARVRDRLIAKVRALETE